MLEEIRQNYINCANRIPDWQTQNKNALINAYIDNEKNEFLREAYFSAIVLRYWGNIGKHYTSSKASGFSIEECYDMLIDAITYLLEKRKWRDPNNPYYNDKCGPDKMMNRCIYSARQLRFYLSNRDKRKANYGKTSLDGLQEVVGDHCEILDSSVLDEYSETNFNEIDFDLFLQGYFDKNKTLYGLILYSIYFDDCFANNISTKVNSEGEKYKVNTPNFKLSRLATNLLSYDTKEVDIISTKYCIDKDKVVKVLNDLKANPKSKTTRLLKSALIKLSEDLELKEYLC